MEPTKHATSGRDQAVPDAITTPDRVETRIGTLEFTDGMPSPDALQKVYEHLDFTHAAFSSSPPCP